MKFVCFAKRIVPFVAAMIIGIMIAGLFSVFSSEEVEVRKFSSYSGKHCREKENRRLMRKLRRLKKMKKKRGGLIIRKGDLNVPPPPPPPPAPVAPEAPPAPPAPPEAPNS